MNFPKLREIDSRLLERELAERKRCIDCKTRYAHAWLPAGPNRIRCADCAEKQPKDREK